MLIDPKFLTLSMLFREVGIVLVQEKLSFERTESREHTIA